MDFDATRFDSVRALPYSQFNAQIATHACGTFYNFVARLWLLNAHYIIYIITAIAASSGKTFSKHICANSIDHQGVNDI